MSSSTMNVNTRSNTIPLPTTVTSLILESLVLSLSPSSSQLTRARLTLTSIASSLRQTALSTPLLWGSICSSYDPVYLQHCLTHSKAARLSIYLKCLAADFVEDRIRFEEFMREVTRKEHLSRWGEITFERTSTPTILTYIPYFTSLSLPSLISLNFVHTNALLLNTSFAFAWSTPSLRDFSASNAFFSISPPDSVQNVKLEWTLRTLSAWRNLVDIFPLLHNLSPLPQLTTLDLTFLSSFNVHAQSHPQHFAGQHLPDSVDFSRPPVSLPHLRALSVTFDGTRNTLSILSILAFLHTPELRTLRVVCIDLDDRAIKFIVDSIKLGSGFAKVDELHLSIRSRSGSGSSAFTQQDAGTDEEGNTSIAPVFDPTASLLSSLPSVKSIILNGNALPLPWESHLCSWSADVPSPVQTNDGQPLMVVPPPRSLKEVKFWNVASVLEAVDYDGQKGYVQRLAKYFESDSEDPAMRNDLGEIQISSKASMKCRKEEKERAKIEVVRPTWSPSSLSASCTGGCYSTRSTNLDLVERSLRNLSLDDLCPTKNVSYISYIVPYTFASTPSSSRSSSPSPRSCTCPSPGSSRNDPDAYSIMSREWGRTNCAGPGVEEWMAGVDDVSWVCWD